jgi:hypothetical protein
VVVFDTRITAMDEGARLMGYGVAYLITTVIYDGTLVRYNEGGGVLDDERISFYKT